MSFTSRQGVSGTPPAKEPTTHCVNPPTTHQTTHHGKSLQAEGIVHLLYFNAVRGGFFGFLRKLYMMCAHARAHARTEPAQKNQRNQTTHHALRHKGSET